MFPDATTTGVPSNVNLTQSGSITISTPGAVVEGLDIHGSVTITAPNVTLKNCNISDGGYNVVLIKPGVTGAVVQNCNIDNQGAGGQGIAGQGTFLNNNIQHAADGIDVRGDNTLIQDNFIHNMSGTSGSHYDGIQADGNFSNLTITHNTIINEHDQTSAVMLDNWWGPIDNVKIDNNLLSGGGYTVYLNEVAQGQAGGGSVTNVSFTNNHIDPGHWGDIDLRTELGHQPTISGNTNDGGAMLQSLHMTGQPTSDASSGSGTTDPGTTGSVPADSNSSDSGSTGSDSTSGGTGADASSGTGSGTATGTDSDTSAGSTTGSGSDSTSGSSATGSDTGSTSTGSDTGSTSTGSDTGSTSAGSDPGSTATGSDTGSTSTGSDTGSTSTGSDTGSTSTGSDTGSTSTGSDTGSTSTGSDTGSTSTGSGSTDGHHSHTGGHGRHWHDWSSDKVASDSDSTGSGHSGSHHHRDHHWQNDSSASIATADSAGSGSDGGHHHSHSHDGGRGGRWHDWSSAKDTSGADSTGSAHSGSHHHRGHWQNDSSASTAAADAPAASGSTAHHADAQIHVGTPGQDSFVFGNHFGNDIIRNFQANGPHHDVIQFSKNVFDNFADVLSNAAQAGHDAVIKASAGDTLTLKDTKVSDLHHQDVHIA